MRIKAVVHQKLFLFFIAFFVAGNLFAQQTIIVDPSGGGDYKTIREALNSLNNKSLSQETTIRIKAGTYTDHLVLENISGTSPQKRIIIESFSGDTADVIIDHDTVAVFPARSAFELRKVQNVVIQNLTFRGPNMEGYMIGFDEGSGNTVIRNNHFIYDNGSSSSPAISLFYNFSATNFSLDSLVLEDNLATNIALYSKYLSIFYFEYLHISNNTVWSDWSIGTKIIQSRNVVVNGNTFYNVPIGSYSEAEHLSVTDNFCMSDEAAMYLSTGSSSQTPALIANNFIVVTNSVGISVGGGNLRIYNNNIYASDSNRLAYGVYLTNGDSVHMVNNIFSGLGSKVTGIFLHDTIFPSSFRCDYNNYYMPKGSFSANIGNAVINKRNSVAQHINELGIDSHSVTLNPLFMSETDLHIRNAALIGKGLHIPGLLFDKDGDPRDPDAPVIGADMPSESIDLVPDQFVSFTGNFYPGKSMEIEYKVKNSGGLDLSSLQWIDEIYLSKDQQIDGSDILLKTVINNFMVPAGQSYTRKQSVSIPYITGGTYYFLLKVNSNSYNFEDTTNNILASQGMNLPTPQLPDLKVTAVNVPPSVFSGKSFTISWTIENKGNAPTSGSWSDYVYVSNNQTLLGNPSIRNADTLIKVKVVAPIGLKPNESYTSTALLSTPIKFSGNLYYRIQTNGNQAIFEQDTTFADNGLVSQSLNVIQSPLPDLAVVGLNIQSTAFSGDTIPVNWTVKNVGKQKTYRTDRYYRATVLQENPRMWYDKLVISKEPFYDPKNRENITKAFYSRPANDELEVDSSYTVNASVAFRRCEYGKYYVFAITNYEYSTFELRYDNNVQLIDSIDLILQPNPDLLPTALSVTNSPATGKPITIDYTVLNDGFDDKSGGYYKDQFYLHADPTFDKSKAKYLGQKYGPDTLKKNEDYSENLSFDLPYDLYGNLYLTLLVDANDQVCEAPGEDNNVKTIGPFNVALSPQPDLVVTAYGVPDTVFGGQNLTLIVATKNIGDAAVLQGSWTNEITLSGVQSTLLKRYRVPVGLQVDETKYDTLNVQIPVGMGAGEYRIMVNADYSDIIFEYQGELNNIYTSGPVTLVRRNDMAPDLEVTGLRISESSPRAGDVITIEVDVRNNEKTTSVTGWENYIYLYDADAVEWKMVTHDHTGRIEHNQTITDEIQFQLPFNLSGDARISYLCNPLNDPLEYERSNNAKDVQLTITPYIPPDLEPIGITLPSCCNVYSLQYDTITVQVRNNGPGPVFAQYYHVKLYLSTDDFIDRADHLLATFPEYQTILNGNTANVRIPVQYPSYRSGSFYLIADVDVEDNIYEGANEDNNKIISGYTIELSNEATDLAMDSLQISNYTGASDAYVNVDYYFSKPLGDTLDRNWTNRVILSRKKSIGPESYRSAMEEYTTNLPSGITSFSGSILASINRDIQPGYYYIGVLLDQRNEIYETSEANNILFSSDSFYFDFSVPLKLDEQKDTNWYEGMFASQLYYHVDRPQGKGMIIDLDVSDDNASTEMYQRAGRIPSTLYYDNKYNNPYLADQQIIVPVTDTSVRDFIYVIPRYMPPVFDLLDPDNNVIDPVPYSILATSAEFSIKSVYPENGSMYGNISVEVTGFDFDTTTTFYLFLGNDTIYPITQRVLNSSHAVIYMDLREHTLGNYTVRAVKSATSAFLADGFEVQDGGFEDPWMNIDLASAELIRNQAVMNINFGNYSNTDGMDYWLVIAMTTTSGSLDHLHTSYVGSSEEEQNELYGFDGNPTGDSTHYDFDNIRFFVYWLPRLAAKSQTTFTYLMNNSEEDTVLVFGLLFRQPMSEYTMSGLPEDLGKCATMYELHDAFSEVAGSLNKASGNCDNLDVENVQWQLAQQTLRHAEGIHGGVATFSSVKSMKDVGQKAYESWKGDVLLPFQAKDRPQDVQREMFKKTVLEDKGFLDIASDYFNQIRHPVDAITGKVYNPEPPFSDLVKNVFSCLDQDPDFTRKALEKCIQCSRHSRPDGSTFQTCHNVCNKTPGGNRASWPIRWVKSFDPNEIVGPDGVTSLRYVDQGADMPYTIRFENLADASAPAISVQINNPLDSSFRLQSFGLTEIGFGDTAFYFNGENNINTVVELGPEYNFMHLHIVAGIDVVNNRAIWRLTTIDPVTGNPVNDPFGGFLPPNDSTGIGEGYVKYTIRLKPDVTPGARVRNRADIIFDQNEIIGTNTWTNIVVDDEPFSIVEELPEYSPSEFTVSWKGSDGQSGPGIHSYTIYVAKDDGQYVEWISYTSDTSAQFIGESGGEYRFFSIVHLLNGSSEIAPTTHDALTRIQGGNTLDISSQGQVIIYPNPGQSVLYVRQDQPAEQTVQLITVDGRIAGKFKINEMENAIDVDHLPDGFYFVRITDGVNGYVYRWIKQR